MPAPAEPTLVACDCPTPVIGVNRTKSRAFSEPTISGVPLALEVIGWSASYVGR